MVCGINYSVILTKIEELLKETVFKVHTPWTFLLWQFDLLHRSSSLPGHSGHQAWIQGSSRLYHKIGGPAWFAAAFTLGFTLFKICLNCILRTFLLLELLIYIKEKIIVQTFFKQSCCWSIMWASITHRG